MKSRFTMIMTGSGLRRISSGILAIAVLALGTTPLWSQEAILSVGNGNTAISLSDSDQGMNLWKKPGKQSDQKTVLKIRSAEQDPEPVRLVKFEGTSDALKVPSSTGPVFQAPVPGLPLPKSADPLPKPSVSNVPLLPPASSINSAEVKTEEKKVPVVAPLTTESPLTKNSTGVTVPLSENEGKIKPSQSPFTKDFAKGTYTDECPDPKSLPSIRELSYKITPQPGLFPENCPLPDEVYVRKAPTPICFTWKASNLCHKPLYFEDPQLERYGHTVCPLAQPFISRARFWLTIPILPYLMGVNPPNECIYDLGMYRPGNCAPYMLNPIPISLRGGLMEAGVIVGGIALFP